MARTNKRTKNQSQRVDDAHGGALLRQILARDGWTVTAGLPPAVFNARQRSRQIQFFCSDQPARTLTAAFKKIQRQDVGKFKTLGVLIAPTTAAMQKLRRRKQADKFPRAFFTSLEELRAAAVGLPVARAEAGGVLSFDAEVLANTAIGADQISHYRLVFKAPQMEDIQPPQFVMMDTTPARVPLGARAVRRGKWQDDVDVAPRPLLKRPFGVYRLFHPHFPHDYLKRLNLPPTLALALHHGCADCFDMLYKVIPNGLGTALMTKLKRGQKVHMLGPLGQPFDVRQLHAQGIEEVHIIGGGVGMAPLVLLVEMLRYYSIPVKVFLGIATLESLRYRDELAATFGEKVRDAYIYIDDLLAAGIKPADLYVSCDREPPGKVVRRIPKRNLFHGLVPEQYRRFLQVCHPERSEGSQSLTGPGEILHFAQNDNAKKIMAFTCGPNRMMEIVTEICAQAGVPLKVLLEKRMGCGIGVCFSCVQKIRHPDGSDDYTRICVEGPLFDAKDILWKNDDSKQPSATSNCAARC